MRSIDGEGRTFSLFASVTVVAILTGTAFLGGTMLARRWMIPSLALPAKLPTAEPRPAPATLIHPSTSVDSTLRRDDIDEWGFLGQVDQAVMVEMWFHPGMGSSAEAEVIVRLITPAGEVLTEKTGSLFLPPHLFHGSLPATGDYRIQVLPLSSAPGRYSLRVSVTDKAVELRRGDLPQHQITPSPEGTSVVSKPRFQWPTHRRSISGWTFKDPRNPGHIGLDIAAEAWDPIVASADGRVVFAEWGGGYGNLVILDHGDGWSSYYAHLTEIAINVGQEIRQGETLGGAGTTGYSTGPHLHFELRHQGKPVDPHVHLP